MKKVNLLIGIAFIANAMTSTCFASLNQFAGRWKNVDSDTRGITTLEITVRGNTVEARAWGSCTPTDCDWGKVNAVPYAPDVSSNLSTTANALTVEFTTNFSKKLLVVKPLRGNILQVDAFTHFTSDNRTNYHNVYNFKPEASPSVQEDCVGFNPRTASVQRISGRWKIIDGRHMMFDFGNNQAEAIKALNIIKHYGMTQSCFMGRPNPSFKYMRVNNEAPNGAFSGEDCISFNPNTIAVRKINSRWKIVDGNHYMFDFADKETEANQAFTIIKKYGFTKSCFVGRPGPSFEYLRR